MSGPPLRFWAIPAAVAALRMLPLLARGQPPDGQAFVGPSYLPKDFLAYTAFVRQAAELGTPLLANPYTTEPQEPRFLLLFHWLVGLSARASGLTPLEALEWSRVPLAFVFFATLWWFLRPLLPEPRTRLVAAVLVGFAGGIEGWLRPFAGALPAAAARRALWETSGLQGWSVFASFYNPLWIAGLVLAMLALRPLLFSARPSAAALAGGAAAWLLAFLTHPYTAIGVLAIGALGHLAAWAGEGARSGRRALRAAAALAPAVLIAAAIAFWQLEEPVYRRSSEGVLGAQSLSPLWYPLTLGLLGALALAGARRALRERRAFRFELLGWVGAVALLHGLPFLNGYKFVFLLPLPLCALAAPVARDLLGGPQRLRALVAGVALFGGVASQTLEALLASRGAVLPAPAMELVGALALRPAANALVPPVLGNALPAYTPHRVWIGHWFLTPDVEARQRTLARLLADPAAAPELRALCRAQRLRYLAVFDSEGAHVARALDGMVAERLPFGPLELFVLDPGHAESAAR